ncbi:MAG: tyrosine-protein phosphatase [Verrucomicrobia bacterium]|nr:tyrosine-protein phosphatase [Verrucomicrobiota bacterium]
MLIMKIQGINLETSRNYFQDLPQPDSVLSKVARVVTWPLVMIAQLFTEVGNLLSRLLIWIRGSDFERLTQLHQNLDPTLFAEPQKHRDRNRYSDILPNEPTRFKIADDPSFYFNANWVLKNRAIACQGPLGNEKEEFWKMVAHGEVETIVMLTNPMEGYREKCTEYWKSRRYTERKIFENGTEAIVERKIQVNSKTIVQYHLQNWPDHSTVSPETLAELVKLVSDREGNLLVHCSAGIGRTGTFLAALEAHRQKTDKIFSIAADLRDPYKGRVGMIQTPEQYHLALKTAELLTQHSNR